MYIQVKILTDSPILVELLFNITAIISDFDSEYVGSTPTRASKFMNDIDIQRAQEIIDEFPNWTRPMSTIESDLVDRYHEYRMAQILNEEDDMKHMNFMRF